VCSVCFAGASARTPQSTTVGSLSSALVPSTSRPALPSPLKSRALNVWPLSLFSCSVHCFCCSKRPNADGFLLSCFLCIERPNSLCRRTGVRWKGVGAQHRTERKGGGGRVGRRFRRGRLGGMVRASLKELADMFSCRGRLLVAPLRDLQGWVRVQRRIGVQVGSIVELGRGHRRGRCGRCRES
jgi:hypothetical protein